jgi:carnitine 3-dehydrogenase
MAKNEEIQNVAIVGTGVIGASWTAYYLSRGFSVVATDPRRMRRLVFASMLTKPGRRSAKTACLPTLRVTG